MRKPLLIALMAATALVPMAAGAQGWQGRRDGGGGGGGQGSRMEQPRADGGARTHGGFEGRGGFDRPSVSAPSAPQADIARPDIPSRPGFGDAQSDFQRARRLDDAPRRDWRGNGGGNGSGDARDSFPRPQRPDTNGSRDDLRGRPGFGDARDDFDRARRWDRDARPDRPATPQVRHDGRDRPLVVRPGGGWNGDGRPDGRYGWNGDRNRDWNGRDDRVAGQRWNRGWRADDRYDWQGWRQRNRQAYRLPRYYAPQGYRYGYQRFGIGLTLGPTLYSRNYWIDDPWRYRLPGVYGPYRWVRYYDDALLVDVYSGRVVDVIYDIFW